MLDSLGILYGNDIWAVLYAPSLFQWVPDLLSTPGTELTTHRGLGTHEKKQPNIFFPPMKFKPEISCLSSHFID